MSSPRIYIPKALAFQRLAKSGIGAASQVDQGMEMNDAHAFALLEYFEFLAPEQLTPLMGPGLAAEISAVIESEFPWATQNEQTPLLNLLWTHAALFAGFFCSEGGEEPKCYRTWLQTQKGTEGAGPFNREERLIENFENAMSKGRFSQPANPKLQLLKYRIARRTAEVLLGASFDPEAALRNIRRDAVPSLRELLAMQGFALQKKNADDMARVCGWAHGSSEATFLHWASSDDFVRYLLEAWQWLRPVSYDEFADTGREPLSERGGLLHAAWAEGKGSPTELALREEPWSEAGSTTRLPRVLGKDVKARFAPVPLMMVGGAGVGKTSFLGALAHHLNHSQGQVRDGLYLESADLQELNEARDEQEAEGTDSSLSNYNLLLRDEGDPEVARWMRLSFTDCRGEEMSRRNLPPALLKRLRGARGLLFFVDDSNFPDLGHREVGTEATGEHEDVADVAARYTRILQLYFDVNKNSLHLPVALVVNKADLLLERSHLLSLNPPSLIPPGTKMDLIHAGLKANGELNEPFERLRHCIRYNLPTSKDIRTQRFVFELVDRFKGFIAAAMGHTYRFQIFLASSVISRDPRRDGLPHGVWDVVKWMVSELDPAYRFQANENVVRARAELEEIRGALRAMILRDRDAYTSYIKAAEQREQITAKVRVKMVDQLLQGRIDHARDRMRTALQEALKLTEVPPIAEEQDPVPFHRSRQLANEAMDRVDEQIAYLTEWHERLCSILRSTPTLPKRPRNEPVRLSQDLASQRRAS